MTSRSIRKCPFEGAESIMKVFAWSLTVGALVLKALAADASGHANFRAEQQAVSIIGLDVNDSQGQRLGRVKELALDLENARIVEVIVSSGGFLGLGRRTSAVPPGALVFDSGRAALRLDMDKANFKAAPSFAMSKWVEHCQSGRVAEVYRYYGQQPYFAADGQNSVSGNTATEPLGYIQRSSKLLHIEVKNLANETLGSVHTFLYNLSAGRVRHVVVLALGLGQTRRVIPARALRFNPAHDTLYLDVSTQAFEDEPRFRWTDGGSSDIPREIYAEYQQETYSNRMVGANHAVATRQNFQEGAAKVYTPLAQGASNYDMDKTRRIYAAMRSDSRLSQNAQNVEVGTFNGRVTLRGHVNTEEGKRIIGDIAAMAGRPESVSNLLEVRPPPVPEKQVQ